MNNEQDKNQFDIAGWAVIDGMYGDQPGRTCLKDAFAHQDDEIVPLTWHSEAVVGEEDCLGWALLENRDEGIYCYGHFYDTENALGVCQAIEDGRVRSFSIFANRLEWTENVLTKGTICSIGFSYWNEQPPEYRDTIITEFEGKPHDISKFDIKGEEI